MEEPPQEPAYPPQADAGHDRQQDSSPKRGGGHLAMHVQPHQMLLHAEVDLAAVRGWNVPAVAKGHPIEHRGKEARQLLHVGGPHLLPVNQGPRWKSEPLAPVEPPQVQVDAEPLACLESRTGECLPLPHDRFSLDRDTDLKIGGEEVMGSYLPM